MRREISHGEGCYYSGETDSRTDGEINASSNNDESFADGDENNRNPVGENICKYAATKEDRLFQGEEGDHGCENEQQYKLLVLQQASRLIC